MSSTNMLAGIMNYVTRVKSRLSYKASGQSKSRFLNDRAADTVTVLDYSADPTGATSSTEAFLLAQQKSLNPYVPEGIYKIDPTLIDITRLRGPGYLDLNGNLIAIEGIVDSGIMGQRKLLSLNYGDGITSAQIYPGAGNALQGIACIKYQGVDKVFITQQVIGTGYHDPTTRTRIAEFNYAEDGRSVRPVQFTDPIPMSHGSDLSGIVENGELFLFSCSTMDPNITGQGGKGYSKLRYRGAATTEADVSQYYLIGQPGDSNPLNIYQSGTITISADGKLVVGVFTSNVGTGRFLIIWDRKEVEAAADPKQVRPKFGPFPIQRGLGSYGSTLQGMASDGRMIYTLWGGGAPGGVKCIQVYTLGGSLQRAFPVSLAASLYTNDELKGKTAGGIPVSFEPEGLTIRGDELIVTGMDSWKQINDIVSYVGYNWASTTTAANLNHMPTDRLYWYKVPNVANKGEWSSTTTYASGPYLKRIKHMFGIATLSLAKGNAPIQGEMDQVSGTAVQYYAGANTVVNRENGGYTVSVYDEATALAYKAYEHNGVDTLLIYDTNPTSGTNNVSIRSTWSGTQWGMQLRSKNGSVAQGAYIDLISTDSPNAPGEARISSVGDGALRLQASGKTMFAATGTECVFYSNERPVTDNTYSKGTASRVYTSIYLQTAPIVSSDERLKTPVRPMSEREINVGRRLAREQGFYQWLDKVKSEGPDVARLHAGMTVQRAIAIFKEEGLDPNRYGSICHDKWDDEFETVPAVMLGTGKYRTIYDSVTGEVRGEEEIMEEWAPASERQTLWAGDKFSFRDGELRTLIDRALAYDQDMILKRLDALERNVA